MTAEDRLYSFMSKQYFFTIKYRIIITKFSATSTNKRIKSHNYQAVPPAFGLLIFQRVPQVSMIGVHDVCSVKTPKVIHKQSRLSVGSSDALRRHTQRSTVMAGITAGSHADSIAILRVYSS